MKLRLPNVLSLNVRSSFICLLAQFLILGTVFGQPMPCTDPPEMTPFCNQACIICDIDGFQGRHESNVQGELPPGFCTTHVHNGQWIAFIAGSQALSVEIQVTNCVLNWGLEIGIYESLDCENFSLVSNCDTNADAGETTTITANVPLTIGQYYYICMDGSGGDNCDWIFSVTNGSTEVSPLTTSGTIEGDFTVCPGITTEYTTQVEEGATIFDWTLNGQPIQGDGPMVAIDWMQDGTYQLCVQASNACDEASPSCTTIVAASFPPQTFDAIICSDESYIVNDTIELFDPGNYEFNFLSMEGCDSTIFVNLEVFEASETIVDVDICEGDSLYIGTTPFFQTGQYVQVLQNYAGCDSIVSLDLFVVICEIEGASDEIPVICFNEASGMIDFQVESGTPTFTYQWQNLENTLSGNGTLNNINEIQTIENLPAGTYLITINDNFGNDLIIIQDVSQPTVLTNDWIVSDYNGTSVRCFQSSDGILEVVPIGGAGDYIFNWNTGAESATISNLPSGNYEVTITDSYGCSLIVQNTLTEPAELTMEVNYTDVNCDGFETGIIEIIGSNGGIGPYEYSFENSAFSDVTLFDELIAGVYMLAVQDANDCIVQNTGVLDAPLIPVIDLGEDLSIFLGDVTDINLTSNIFLDSLIWNEEFGLSCYNCPEPTAGPYFNTTYNLIAISEDGCIDTDSINIEVIERRRVFVPNVFSPNNDGLNDVFSVYAGPEANLVVDFKVFSRWGNLVFEQNDFLPNSNEGWDGTFNGKLASAGIYVWHAKVIFLDSVVKEYKGDVMLIR